MHAKTHSFTLQTRAAVRLSGRRPVKIPELCTPRKLPKVDGAGSGFQTIPPASFVTIPRAALHAAEQRLLDLAGRAD
jgi:hypothetical protein